MRRYQNSTKSKLSHTIQVKVRFGETDAMGVVWHGNYLKYFEDGREAFGEKFGMTYTQIKNQNLVTPIVSFECQHLKSITFGDEIKVETRYINTLAAKIIFQYAIYNSNEELVCLGKTEQVFVSQLGQGELQLYFPEFYKEWKKNKGLI